MSITILRAHLLHFGKNFFTWEEIRAIAVDKCSCFVISMRKVSAYIYGIYMQIRGRRVQKKICRLLASNDNLTHGVFYMSSLAK